MIRMTEKWIHRECAKEDLNPEYTLIQPTVSRSHTPCALCGLSHGMQFLYEVGEAYTPLEEVLEVAEEVAVEAIVVSVIEAVEVIEEVNEKEAEIARLKAQLAELEK